MKCEDLKNLIPDFLEGALDPNQEEGFRQHLGICEECQAQLADYEHDWELLGEWQEAEPDAGYVSRFWTRISQQKSWNQRLREAVQNALVPQKPARAYAAVVGILIVGVVAFHTTRTYQTRYMLSRMSPEDMEIVEFMELAENLYILEDLELLEDMEIIENET